MKRYLGWEPARSWTVITVNAHPPTSVLLAFPFVGLDFPTAFLIWNLLSLLALGISILLLAKGLGIPISWSAIFSLVTISVLCNPLIEQLRQGQLNLVLLALITGVWACDRSGRQRTAGILLGTASAIKLFPALLVFYFLLRRRRQLAAWAIGTFVGFTAATAWILGREAYRSYVVEVVPLVQSFRGGWDNSSLIGYWTRLFDTSPNRDLHLWPMQPLWENPGLAWIASAVSIGLIIAAAGWLDRPKRARDPDSPFALAVTATLLVTPIVWEHYFVMLVPSLAIAWWRLPNTWQARGLFASIVCGLWLPPQLVWRLIGLGARTAGPLDALGLLSFQFYSLLALFFLIASELHHMGRSAGSNCDHRQT